MKSGQIDLTIIIPALNESEQLSMTLDEINRTLGERISYEIVVIDDASIDGTALIAKEHGADIVIRTKSNVGKVRAIELGLSKASGPIVVTMDADGVFNPKDIPKITRPILEGKADLVIGSDLYSYRQESALRVFGIFLTRLLIRLYLGIDEDIFSSFRAIRTRLLRQLLRSQPKYVEPEIPVLAIKQGYRLTEIPVRGRLRKSFGYSQTFVGGGSKKRLSDIVNLLLVYSRYGSIASR